MSRNRMKNSQSLHWMGVVKWVLISGLVAGLGLVYMLCKNQNLHLAAETRRLEIQLATIETRNKELNGDLESLKTIRRLQAKLKEVHSDLVSISDPSVNLLSLEQNPHARVQMSPRIMKVAVPCSQHSPMLGQRALSHTV